MVSASWGVNCSWRWASPSWTIQVQLFWQCPCYDIRAGLHFFGLCCLTAFNLAVHWPTCCPCYPTTASHPARWCQNRAAETAGYWHHQAGTPWFSKPGGDQKEDRWHALNFGQLNKVVSICCLKWRNSHPHFTDWWFLQTWSLPRLAAGSPSPIQPQTHWLHSAYGRLFSPVLLLPHVTFKNEWASSLLAFPGCSSFRMTLWCIAQHPHAYM